MKLLKEGIRNACKDFVRNVGHKRPLERLSNRWGIWSFWLNSSGLREGPAARALKNEMKFWVPVEDGMLLTFESTINILRRSGLFSIELSESEVFCWHRVRTSNTRKSAVEQGNMGQNALDTEWVCLATTAMFVLLVTRRVEWEFLILVLL